MPRRDFTVAAVTAQPEADPVEFTLGGVTFGCVDQLTEAAVIAASGLRHITPDPTDDEARVWAGQVIDFVTALVVDPEAFQAHVLSLAPTTDLIDFCELLAELFAFLADTYINRLPEPPAAGMRIDVDPPSTPPVTSIAREVTEWHREPSSIDDVTDMVLAGVGELGGR